MTQLTPEDFLSQVEAVLPKSTKAERARLLEHARAWTMVVYTGNPPDHLAVQLSELEATWLTN